MSDTERTFEMADLASLTVSGPTVLFVRPTRPLSVEEARDLFAGTHHFLKPLMPMGLRLAIVPHDFELMVLGEGELKKLGYVNIEDAARRAREMIDAQPIPKDVKVMFDPERDELAP